MARRLVVPTGRYGGWPAQLTGAEWRARVAMPMFGPMDSTWLPENQWMRRSLLAAIVLYGWTLFGILSSAHFFLGEEAKSGMASLLDIAGHVLLFYWAWAAVTPLVLMMLRRATDRGTTSSRRWAIVALSIPAIVAVHGALYLIAVHISGVEDETPFGIPELGAYAMRHAGGDLATVAVLAAVYLLFHARQQAHEREVAATALEARAAAADLEVLRWQLQPHFLFNALNTVSTLVLKGDAPSADEAIGRISRYLRSALAQRAGAMVTVTEEISDVQRYFAIERLRFGDDLCLDLLITSAARSVRIPALIVQPLVENAIRHGLSPDARASRILLKASASDSRLTIAVRDPASCNETFAERKHEGFGLRYVRERLLHFYGDEARLTLEPSLEGTSVTIEVPLIARREEARA